MCLHGAHKKAIRAGLGALAEAVRQRQTGYLICWSGEEIACPDGTLREPELVVPAHASMGEAQDAGEDFLAVEASRHPPEGGGTWKVF